MFHITGHAGFISSTVRELARVAKAPELGFRVELRSTVGTRARHFLKGLNPTWTLNSLLF